jgi:hypothetical protein
MVDNSTQRCYNLSVTSLDGMGTAVAGIQGRLLSTGSRLGSQPRFHCRRSYPDNGHLTWRDTTEPWCVNQSTASAVGRT